MNHSGVQRMPLPEMEKTAQALAVTGWRLIYLAGGSESKADFFRAVRDSVPLNPPLSSPGRDNWDALDDSMWCGLHELPDAHIAIVWPGASLMEKHDPGSFAIATDMLAGICTTLADEKYTGGAPKTVLVIQAG